LLAAAQKKTRVGRRTEVRPYFSVSSQTAMSSRDHLWSSFRCTMIAARLSVFLQPSPPGHFLTSLEAIEEPLQGPWSDGLPFMSAGSRYIPS
jgi:hypothetical protein